MANNLPKVYELFQVSERLEINALTISDLPSQAQEKKRYQVTIGRRGNLNAWIQRCSNRVYKCGRRDNEGEEFIYIPPELVRKHQEARKSAGNTNTAPKTKEELVASILAKKKQLQEAKQQKRQTELKLRELNRTIDYFLSENCRKVTELEDCGHAKHPYLADKKVDSIDTLFFCNHSDIEEIFHYSPKLNGELILAVPLISDDESSFYTSVEFIDGDGNKRLLRGGKVRGSYWKANYLVAHPAKPQILGICEGVATTLSVMEHTTSRGGFFYSAINCGNLEAVALNLRKQYPSTPIVIFADWDKPKGNSLIGIGEKHAQEVAKKVSSCLVRLPPFTDEFRNKFKRRYNKDPTDWNDFFYLE